MRRIVLFTIAAVLLSFFATLAGCAQELAWPVVKRSIASDFPAVRHVTTDSLAEWLDASERGERAAPLLLDAREPDEYAVSHLRGAKRIDPDASPADALPAALEGVEPDAPVVLYCSVGYRSSKLAAELQEAGFTNVANLEGSIFEWANEGREVVRGQGEDAAPVRAVHPYDATWGRLLDRELRQKQPEQ
jgi:rhodanese-related sulfurtransferase